MMRDIVFATGVLACCAGYAVLAQNAPPITGQWTVGGSVVQDKIQLSIQRTAGPDSHMSSSSPILVAQLQGLTRAQLDSTGSVVRFESCATRVRFDSTATRKMAVAAARSRFRRTRNSRRKCVLSGFRD
jgi:hypothetical protein